MPDEIRTIDLILSAVGLVLSILGMVHTTVGRDIETKTRNFFGQAFFVSLLPVLITAFLLHLCGEGEVETKPSVYAVCRPLGGMPDPLKTREQ